MTHLLLLKGGRLIDPSQALDGALDVAFADGQVVQVGPNLAVPSGATVLDVTGRIVTPGFIDIHTHVYWGGTSLGIEAEVAAMRGGVTTQVDAGSAGPGNFAGFLKHVIEPSAVRILAFLHVSFAGIYAFSQNVMVGESADMRLISPVDAVAVARANPATIIGIKVRVGRHASGSSGIAPLDVALQVADETGLPLMVHIDEPPPSYDEVLARLRPGDTLTHAFRAFPNSPIAGDGSIRSSVFDARARGVLFDIGHGMGSFSFEVGRRMLDGGFPPDTISSDIHILNQPGPVHDQATTLSKFLALGMALPEVVAATTSRAAAAIRRDDLGTFRPGTVADASIFTLENGAHVLTDSVGRTITASHRIVIDGRVLGGRYTPSLPTTSR